MTFCRPGAGARPFDGRNAWASLDHRQGRWRWTAAVVILLVTLPSSKAERNSSDLGNELAAVLEKAAFTGAVQHTLETRLGRHINKKLANLGRLLWFDNVGGLHSDNTCGGC